jgi:hypothetical protein
VVSSIPPFLKAISREVLYLFFVFVFMNNKRIEYLQRVTGPSGPKEEKRNVLEPILTPGFQRVCNSALSLDTNQTKFFF